MAQWQENLVSKCNSKRTLLFRRYAFEPLRRCTVFYSTVMPLSRYAVAPFFIPPLCR
jgi:hypothetical protein